MTNEERRPKINMSSTVHVLKENFLSKYRIAEASNNAHDITYLIQRSSVRGRSVEMVEDS
jgi:hypothetical protein